jgi:hypothetical protein
MSAVARGLIQGLEDEALLHFPQGYGLVFGGDRQGRAPYDFALVFGLEVPGVDKIALGEKNPSGHSIFQLPDIAGPGSSFQGGQSGTGKLHIFFVEKLGVSEQKIFGQQGDVTPPVPKGW